MYLDFFSDLLFPPACLGCSRKLAAGVLCEPCEHAIEIFETLFCGTCGARLPELKKICHLDAPYMLGTATRYDDVPMQALIRGLKFYGLRGAAKPLSALLIKYVAGLNINLRGFTVMPIPLSRRRERGRGFNQSQLIAEYFAAHFDLALEKNVLFRTLHNKPQSETDDILERRENIHGCFSLAPDCGTVPNKNIILVDDVTTSGTTFLEAAQVLKARDAKKIIALAVAQA